MAQTIDDVRARFARCGSLAEAIVAGLALAPPWSVVDVVVQDEFTHDLVMAPGAGAPAAAAAAGGPAIVLDCT